MHAGALNRSELVHMLTKHGLGTSNTYVDGIMRMFGNFDDDMQGKIEFSEFGELWEQLGGSYNLWEHSMTAQHGPLTQLFVKYDSNKDHNLDLGEVENMMQDLGYNVDGAYVQDLFAKFTANDTDGNGPSTPCTLHSGQFIAVLLTPSLPPRP